MGEWMERWVDRDMDMHMVTSDWLETDSLADLLLACERAAGFVKSSCRARRKSFAHEESQDRIWDDTVCSEGTGRSAGSHSRATSLVAAATL
jgi:hypothetical protein